MAERPLRTRNQRDLKLTALGGAYRDELETARGHGWPTRSLQLTHLATVTSPVETADAVLSVVAELD